MKSTIASSALPEMRCGWTYPSRPSVVSGERRSVGSEDTRSAASLTAFTSLPFAASRVHREAADGDADRLAENVSISSSPTPEPSSVYATSAPKASRSKSSAPRPTSSSTVKAMRMGARVRSGCRTRYATAAMISAIPALSSAPSSVVPSLVTMSCPTRAASSGSFSGSSTWRASPGSTIGAPSHASCTIGVTPAPRDVRRRVDVRDQPDDGGSVRAREPGEDRRALGQLDVLEPELAQLLDEEPREVELLLGARTASSAIGRLRVDPDVAQEPLERRRPASSSASGLANRLRYRQARPGGGRSRSPRRPRARGTRRGTSRSASARSSR